MLKHHACRTSTLVPRLLTGQLAREGFPSLRSIAVIACLIGLSLPLPAFAQLEEDVIAPRKQQALTEQSRQSNISPNAAQQPDFPTNNHYLLFFGRHLSRNIIEYKAGFGYDFYVELHTRSGTASDANGTFDLTGTGIEFDLVEKLDMDNGVLFLGIGTTRLSYTYTPNQAAPELGGTGSEIYFVLGVGIQLNVLHARIQVKSTNGSYADPESVGPGETNTVASYFSLPEDVRFSGDYSINPGGFIDGQLVSTSYSYTSAGPSTPHTIPDQLKQDGTEWQFIVGLGF